MLKEIKFNIIEQFIFSYSHVYYYIIYIYMIYNKKITKALESYDTYCDTLQSLKATNWFYENWE